MRRIMVTGPAGAGKTTLAKALEPQYMWINFTDTLKTIAVQTLMPVRPISLRAIQANKEFYRPYLIELCKVIRFDTDSKYIEAALYSWHCNGQPSVIFDNVRTAEQTEYLRNTYEFKLVRLNIPLDVQARRLHTVPATDLAIDHIEADLELDGTLPVKELADAVRACV